MSHGPEILFTQVPDGVFSPTGPSGPTGPTGPAGGAFGETGATGGDGGDRIGDILWLQSQATTGNMAASGAGVALIFDNLDSTIDADYSHTDGTTDIIIDTTGWYRIEVNCSYRNTNTTLINNAILDFSIQRDPLGVGSFANLSGSLFHASISGDTETNDWNCRPYSKTIFANLTATDEIRVWGINVGGGSGVGRWRNGTIHMQRIS